MCCIDLDWEEEKKGKRSIIVMFSIVVGCLTGKSLKRPTNNRIVQGLYFICTILCKFLGGRFVTLFVKLAWFCV